jgi:hypothetical protein
VGGTNLPPRHSSDPPGGQSRGRLTRGVTPRQMGPVDLRRRSPETPPHREGGERAPRPCAGQERAAIRCSRPRTGGWGAGTGAARLRPWELGQPQRRWDDRTAGSGETSGPSVGCRRPVDLGPCRWGRHVTSRSHSPSPVPESLEWPIPGLPHSGGSP